jgi:hypothetical protein
MITHTQKFLFCAIGLFMAGSLLAHVTGSSHQPHKNIEFQDVTATYRFQDGTAAHWKANQDGSYAVTLVQDPALKDPHPTTGNGDGAISLLSIGVQAIDNRVEVALVTGTGVEVLDTTKPTPTWVTLQPMGGKVTFKKTGTKAGEVDEDNVSFIRFTGTSCELWVSSSKVRIGKTRWHGVGPKSSHDNTPPGVPPGSEN